MKNISKKLDISKEIESIRNLFIIVLKHNLKYENRISIHFYQGSR
mgnify:CR=1